MLTANQVLKNLANSQENTWVGKKSCFKKETPIQGFPVNFLKLLDKIFFVEHLRWLLLCIQVNLPRLKRHVICSCLLVEKKARNTERQRLKLIFSSRNFSHPKSTKL